MDYERGLEQLIEQARGTDWFGECALYEARLRDNLHEERRYGSTEQTRASRAQIIDQLNQLTYKQLNRSFVDLCRHKPIRQLPQATYYSDTLDGPHEPDVLIQNASAPQTIHDDAELASPAKVFIGYSHKDGQYLEELRTHLAYNIRAGKVVCWDDAEIPPGTVWREEIKKALQEASMAILLVSANFLASDFIINNELPHLLASAKKGEMMVISVIVRPCLFEDTDLAQFQTINSPSQPLSMMSHSKRDEVWIKVVEYIKHHH